ncbi:ATP-binding protein [Bacteroides uniformis]|uniref:AlbA family DNA-binding domain-containing protein n=1 Tax=Bacteroides uniformis TaxID=820 RepID=UPI001F3B2B7B|nr:ATP-binding protein [Bacteroides uniformis]MCE8485537.1 ATP-binding protein [Bacteroides uniformis]UVS18653.1 ATP-binding protein [Bacteroides uniformis]
MVINSIADLERLIENKIPESTTLEYKSSFATQNKKWKEELAKDISAMANSNGGVIIYGIREKECEGGDSVPEKLLPISNSDMSKDQLTQLISSNIQPVINGVEIIFIPYDAGAGFYIVTIPQSNTAHQNRLTHIYYKRRNATVEAMEDYEIRDIMNRSKTPIIDVEFTLIKTIVDITTKKYPMNFLAPSVTEEKSKRIDFRLKFRPKNNGQILAKYINFFVYIPDIIIADKDKYEREDYYRIVFEDNTIRDVVGFEGMVKKYGPARYDPILPGIYGSSRTIDLDFSEVESIDDIPQLKYEMHADNAPTREVLIKWEDVKLVENHKEEYIDPMAPPRFGF